MISPDGRYEVTFHEHEAFNTHWVQTPTLIDRQSGERLLTFDTRWSVDEREWLGDSVARFHMRKYPGNHDPGELVVTLDCVARTATLGAATIPFAELERRMDAALDWIHAKPVTKKPAGLLARLQRLLRGG